MNKGDLVDRVAAATGATKASAQDAVDAVLDEITRALRRGDKVGLTGFGTFEVRSRSERKGRNPQTGEPLVVAASKAPAFKAGKALKDAVN